MEINSSPTNIIRNDFGITHRSTAPATDGKDVQLFVREVDGTPLHGRRKCVLMVHGRSIPSITTFDLQHNNYNYSWAQSLAQEGFDVLMFDLQGSLLSPIPQMEDPCNTSRLQQGQILMPNPIPEDQFCNSSYPFVPISSQSEWDELDTVVNWIIKNRDVDKVAFISNSAGAFAVGPYSVQHQDKVETIFFSAPIYPPNGLTNAPATLPVPGVPMTVQTKKDFKTYWDNEIINCPNQREDGMVDIVWSSLMEIDQIGGSWGKPDVQRTEGVLRFRNFTHWSWNTEAVSHGTLGQSVPVCIIYGENDKTVMQDTGVPATTFNVKKLYSDIPDDNKLMFKIACAGHQIMWETNAQLLFQYSSEWLKKGKIKNRKKGSYYRDKNGDIYEVKEPVKI